jgi:uncharacterized protein
MEEYNAYSAVSTQTGFLSKVFGWLFVGLGLSAGVAIGMYFALLTFLPIEAYTTVLIGATIAYFALMIFIQVRIFRNRVGRTNKSIAVPYILYSIVMGIELSTLMLAYDMSILAASFGVTALVFGVMGAYGYFTKRNLNVMGTIAIGVLIGGLILTLINFLLQSESLYWIVSFATFGAVMLITAYDMWRMKGDMVMGRTDTNNAMFWAFRLYVDFIYLFIRITGFLGAGRRR